MKTTQNNYNKYSYQDDNSHSVWDARQLLQILADRVWILGLCLIATIGLAAAYLLVTPKSYSSTAVLYVEQRDQKVVSIQDVSQQDLESSDMMKTVEQSLTTDDILMSVIKNNHLADNADFVPKKPLAYTDDELLKTLNQRIKVKVRRGTRLIDVTAKTQSALLSQQIVQSLINEYQEQNLNQRTAIATAANSFLFQEVDKLKAKLEKSESDLAAYREQNNAVSLEEKQNIVVDTLKDLNVKLGEARSERMKLESDVATYREASTNAQQLSLISSVATDPAVLDAQNRVSNEEQIIAGLAQRYRPAHPKYIDAQAQLTQLKDALNSVILKSGAQIGAAYASALDNEQKIGQALKDQEQQAMQLDKIAIPYNVLARTVEADRDLYQSMVTRLKETDVTRSLDLTQVRVIAAPRVSAEAVGPKTAMILALSIFLGVFGGVGLCVFVSSLDASMRNVDEAEDALQLQVLASIPHSRGKRNGHELPMLTQPYSAATEAFRSLRTALELKEVTDHQAILFTSSSAAEGKTFCSVNCAVALAHQGYKTLIVDTDLRHPSVGKSLGLPSGQPGLADCLAGKARASEIIQDTKIAGLFALTAGTLATNCSELMSAARLTKLLSDATFAGFERIIFDSAPVNAVSDALHLVKHATAICLVVQAGRTPVKAAQRANAALAGARAKDIGIILNRVAPARYNPYGYDFREPKIPATNGRVVAPTH
jgi:capsular exopolysaccharide synthesis family protein